MRPPDPHDARWAGQRGRAPIPPEFDAAYRQGRRRGILIVLRVLVVLAISSAVGFVFLASAVERLFAR